MRIVTFLTLSSLLLLTACSSSNLSDTAYNYEYQPRALPKMDTVLIATINREKPSRFYLKPHEEDIDQHVADFLEAHDIKLLPNRLFESQWSRISSSYGNMFNPSTGRYTPIFDTAVRECMEKVFARNPELDAIIFTDLIETPIAQGNTINKIAQWHGVNRKIKTQGVGEGLDKQSDWLEAVDGISLAVTVYNRNLEQALFNIGGIQVAEVIELHNKVARLSRRSDILYNDDEIEEGITLAFHPLIPMKNYPKQLKSPQ